MLNGVLKNLSNLVLNIVTYLWDTPLGNNVKFITNGQNTQNPPARFNPNGLRPLVPNFLICYHQQALYQMEKDKTTATCEKNYYSPLPVIFCC
jgi:hypothetical protein